MKKLFIVILVIVIAGYIFVPKITINLSEEGMVSYINKFNNSPELKREAIELVHVAFARVRDEGTDKFFSSMYKEDAMYLAKSMDKIKDNAQGLLDTPISDENLHTMVRKTRKILGLEPAVEEDEQIVDPEKPDVEEKISAPEVVHEKISDADLEKILMEREEDDRIRQRADVEHEKKRHERMQETAKNYTSQANEFAK